MKKGGIFGIYLAAGQSRRMETDKLFLSFGNTALGSYALYTALHSKLDYMIVVTKKDNSLKWVDPVLFSDVYKQRWSSVACREADRGQAYSLKAGLAAAKSMGADAVVVLLADQPLLSLQTINELIIHYEKARNIPFAASFFQGIMRPPILFSAAFFPQIMKLEGDKGARELLKQKVQTEGLTIEFNRGRDFYDIDTKEDYEWIKEVEKI